jgi:aldehyde:ferredoxin oxidoreductase
MINGYQGRMLQIDLTQGKSEAKPLDPRVAERYLGGRGMATRILYDLIDPACDPLGEDNVVVLATSPLIGTQAPTAGRGHMVFKSPLTGVIGSSNCGGSWAPVFKSTGYDVLIIKGKASSPVMVDLTPEGCRILPADHLWGKDCHETTDLLSEGSRPKILCIGPAGENLVRISSVMNDKNRTYGRCGGGAVFGAKNLKAVRVEGKLKVEVKDQDKFQSGLDQARYLLKQAPVTKRLLKELGTVGLFKLIHLIDMLPHRNFQDNVHDEALLNKVSGEAIRDTILEKPGACFRCPIACQRHTKVQGKKGEGPEYETTVMMGPTCDIYDLCSIARANYYCNEYGIDTISFGGTIACAMELYENGHLTWDDAGMELGFGTHEVLEDLTHMIAFREGFGEKLAEGSLRLAERYGHPEYSMSIKGMEIPAYDPRASYTQALGYMTSPTGACHLRGGYAVSLAFFGGAKEIPRFSVLQSPIAIRNMQNHGIIQDSLGICRFTGFAFSSEPWSRMMSGLTGLDFSTSKLEEAADRIAGLERLFNLEAGATIEDDVLPKRFRDDTIMVSGDEMKVPDHVMERLRSDYYELMGWDEGGRPVEKTLKKLEIKRR